MIVFFYQLVVAKLQISFFIIIKETAIARMVKQEKPQKR